MLSNISLLLFFLMIAACVMILYIKIYSATKQMSIDVSFFDLYVELHKRMLPMSGGKLTYNDGDALVIKNLERSIAKTIFGFTLACFSLMAVFVICSD